MTNQICPACNKAIKNNELTVPVRIAKRGPRGIEVYYMLAVTVAHLNCPYKKEKK